MTRSIAVVTHQLNPQQEVILEQGIWRLNQLMRASDIDISCTNIGTLLDNTTEPESPLNFPNTNPDGSYKYKHLNAFVPFNLKHNPDYQEALGNYTDVLLAVGNRIVQENARQWHTRIRNGQAYGLADSKRSPSGSYGCISTNPVSSLESRDGNKYIDYILCHELGHMLGGFSDLGKEDQDDIMRPLVSASPRYLRSKVTTYSFCQLSALRENTNKLDAKDIFAHREWVRRQQPKKATFKIA